MKIEILENLANAEFLDDLKGEFACYAPGPGCDGLPPPSCDAGPLPPGCNCICDSLRHYGELGKEDSVEVLDYKT